MASSVTAGRVLLGKPFSSNRPVAHSTQRVENPALRPRYGSTLAARASEDEGGSWDPSRFLQTVSFFNPPGELLVSALTAPLRLTSAALRAVLPASPATVEPAVNVAIGGGSDTQRSAILVTGAESPVGLAVVSQLLARGCRVRALVPDRAAASVLTRDLPRVGGIATGPHARLELAYASSNSLVSFPKTLTQNADGDDEGAFQAVTPEMVAGVGSWVCCMGGPSESGPAGQAPDLRAYTDSVAVDMKALLRILGPQLGAMPGPALLGLDEENRDPRTSVTEWGPLDDVVMGGASKSSLYASSAASGVRGDLAAVFSGVVTGKNNGGFASVRSRNYKPPLNLSGYEGLRVRVRGDGQRYKFTIRCVESWDSVAYSQSVDTPKGEWATLDLPFSAFKAAFRAQSKPDATPLDRGNVVSLQIMLSKFEYDGALNPNFQTGAFELPIQSITAYSKPTATRLIYVSTAAEEADPVPPRALSTAWTEAAGDTVRNCGVPYTIVRARVAANADVGAHDPRVGPGLEGPGEEGVVGLRDLGCLCAHLLTSSAALNTTIQVASERLVTAENASVDHEKIDWEVKLRDGGLAPDAETLP